MIPPKPKKQFGQHFLKDKATARKICGSLRTVDKKYRNLLEIGPGKGVLTEHLLGFQETKLYVVEIDDYWADFILRTWPELEGKIIKEDVLALDLEDVAPGEQMGIIGNFPYNIAGRIMVNILKNNLKIPEVVGMFQLEVAQRLCSPPGSKQYGLLSVLFQSYYHVRLLFKLPPGAFNPPPKVKSAVIRGVRKTEDYPQNLDFQLFLQIIKTAFQKRRKKLSNALKAYSALIREHNPELLDKRPEDLTSEEFQRITKWVGENRNS